MGPATHDQSPDVLMRVSAGVVVPVVAVAAHGLGSGSLPGSGGMVLSASIGVLVGLVLGGRRRQSATSATVLAIAVLTLAQIGAHISFTVGHTSSAMHHDALLPMLLTHLVAVPVSAVCIVAAAVLLDAVTRTFRRLAPLPRITAPGVRPARWDAPLLVIDVVIGGAGVRGPPVVR